MTVGVLFILLAAALMHAGWNALVKRDQDRVAAAIAVAAGGAVIAAAMLPFLAPMDMAAVPYVIATSIIHILYFLLIARAYRYADLSVAYPLMRGTAPLIVTAIGAVLFAEVPGLFSMSGIVLLSLGIISLGLDGFRGGLAGRSAVLAALANGLVIAAYTLVDGQGVRVAGEPLTYIAWIMFASGVVNVVYTLAVSGGGMLRRLTGRVWVGLGGGGISFASYGLALWAMTFAPIGLVAAVRESSVLFAAAIGALFLGERFGPGRWIAAALVATGLAAIKFGAS